MDTHETQALLDELRSLRAEVAELRAKVDGPTPALITASGGAPKATNGNGSDGRQSRRDLFKLAGVGGAVAAATVVGSAMPAAAVDGNPVILGADGATQTSESRTEIKANADFAGADIFLVDDDPDPVGNLPASAAIRGRASGAVVRVIHGVFGESSRNAGAGVIGIATGLGSTGVAAAVGANGRSNLFLVPGGANPYLRTDTHLVGDVLADAAGNTWLCVVGGIPGKFRLIGGPLAAGGFVALGAPTRAYDSRTSGGPLASGVDRLISLAAILPANTTSCLFNLTIVNTIGQGFLKTYSADVGEPTASAINWFASGLILANNSTTAVNPGRQIRVKAGGGGITDFVIDILGFYI